MKITVNLKGIFAASLGCSTIGVEIKDGSTVLDVIKKIGLSCNPSWVCPLINGKNARKDSVLTEGDILLMFPLGGGG